MPEESKVKECWFFKSLIEPFLNNSHETENEILNA